MKTVEEVIYEAGRHSLTDQESVVAGIRQRTGTLLAAHAIVASFLGSAAIREQQGLGLWGAIAVGALVLSLVTAVVLLSTPWNLNFAVGARELYSELYEEAAREAEDGTLGWLVGAGYGYQDLHSANKDAVDVMSWLSFALGVLIVAQTVAWLLALVLA